MKQDPQKINLSLVSHTNVGKTTLARTLLGRDIGEIEDRSHITSEPEAYVLLRTPDDNELILWDTPGFGDSYRLAKRLESRDNPISWAVSEIWDRFAERTLWLNQQAIKHVKEQSDVILYLVNASEPPDTVTYVPAEMKILAWIDKPVIVLLNQMGEVRPPEEEAKELNTWKDFMLKGNPVVKSVIPLDAFARCWAQEYQLWEEIDKCLDDSQKPAFDSLKSTWFRQKQAIYSSSIEAMADYLTKIVNDKEIIVNQNMIDRLKTVGRTLGFISNDLKGAQKDAQVALSVRAADELCNLASRLVIINGLKGKATQKEILKRLREDWNTQQLVDPTAASIFGAIAGGAITGLAADIVSGGLTLGAGTIGGAIAGALGGAGMAKAYNIQKGAKENQIAWSPKAMEGFVIETELLYLAVAHFGRGRGQWEQSESPKFWQSLVEKLVQEQNFNFSDLAQESTTADERKAVFSKGLDTITRKVFKQLYNVTI
ncbi:MAG: DUF3482 domain-containing protein [Burkholderiales bacterium]|nr:DUF3482 domain-containing protein [Burkholderiales bacterium]